MSQNISLLLAEAKALYDNINALRLSEPELENLLSKVVYDLSCIGKVISTADNYISQEEKIILSIFLKYSLFDSVDLNFLESWKLLDAAEKSRLTDSIEEALKSAPESYPEKFKSVEEIGNISQIAGSIQIVEKYASHLFRFAQVLANSHRGQIQHSNSNISNLRSILSKQVLPFRKSSNRYQTDLLDDVEKKSKTEQDNLLKVNNIDLQQEIEKLNKLIGLQSVKEEVQSLINLPRLQQARKQQGLKSVDVSLHAVFAGPPGTGKTTVARIYARILKAMNIIKGGQLVETDRVGLVAEYVGQTAMKTDKLIEQARGGVLFIDEAYSLMSGSSQGDFGKEAIEIILKRMEDLRNDLVVIVAGYPNEMAEFINSNPGLASRFSRKIDFPHYNSSELKQILLYFAKDSDYKLSLAAQEKLSEICSNKLEKANQTFGNAREMRNLFESALRQQANRLSKEKVLSKESLETLELEDFIS